MNDRPPNKQAIRQRKLRARQRLAGGKRLDIHIPADLWARLKPRLMEYGNGTHPGHSLILLLKNIQFSDE